MAGTSNLNVLPLEIMEEVLKFSGPNAILKLCRTNSHHAKLCKDPNGLLWRTFLQRDFPGVKVQRSGLKKGTKAPSTMRDTYKLFRSTTYWTKLLKKSKDMRYARLGGETMPKINYVGVDFTNANLRKTGWGTATFRDCTFRGANLSQSDMFSVTITDSDFSGANLTDVSLSESLAADNKFDDATFRGATLVDTDFTRSTFEDADFEGATVTNADFTDANVRGTVLYDDTAVVGHSTAIFTGAIGYDYESESES